MKGITMAIEVVIPKTKKRTLFMRFLCVTRYLKTLDIRKVLLILVTLISFDIFINGIGLANQRKLYRAINNESYQTKLLEQQIENTNLRKDIEIQKNINDNLLQDIKKLKGK